MKRILLVPGYTTLIAALFAISFAVSCKKENDATGNSLQTVTGTLYLKSAYDDTLAPLRILPNQMVYIRVDTGSNKDTSNYFYATQTDNKGNFSFYVSDTTRPYSIFTALRYRSSPSFNPLYSGITTISRVSATLGTTYNNIASIDTSIQNGAILSTMDINNQPIPNVKQVLLYTSKLIADSDAASFSGANVFTNTTTDSLGKSFVAQMPGYSVYINARVIVAKDTLKAIAVPIFVPQHKNLPFNIILK
jgi:hypothetical protein